MGATVRLVHVTTVPDSLLFLRGQVGFMKANGFSVSVVSSPGPALEAFAREEAVEAHALEMPRRITPATDAATVARLAWWLKRRSPQLVHAHTPKGGLLGMLAASAARVPVRLYQMRGLPMITAHGWKRTLLRNTERVSCTLAHRVICQSPSLRTTAIEEHLVAAARCQVIGLGSNGVDAQGKFNPARFDLQARAAVRAELGIPVDALVIGFVGRLVGDKGVVELFHAWTGLRRQFSSARLLLVGPFEPRDPIPPEIRSALQSDDRVSCVGFTADTPRMYSAMDLVTLPTYREGFPNVPLEAAAMGLPVVATSIPGCLEAVEHARTGLLVPAKDAQALQSAMETYLNEPELRSRHGQAGRQRVLSQFNQERLWEELLELYRRELSRT